MLNIYQQQHPEDDELKPTAESTSPRTSEQVNFKAYVDPTGELDSNKLGYGIWFVEHRVQLYRAVIFVLGVLCVVLWGYSLVRWGIWLYQWPATNRLERQIARTVNYAKIAKRFAPTPVQIMSSGILPGGVGKFDAVAELANVDEHFIATVTYYFDVGGVLTPKRTVVMLPGEERPVVELGLPDAAEDADVLLKIVSVAWKRVPVHKVSDARSWQEDHLNFSLSDKLFRAGQDTPDGLKVNIISFNLTNDTPYSYMQPSFYVGLYNEDTLVGIMPLTLKEFRSLQTVPVDLRNFVTNLTVTDIKVFPLINVYDRSVYSTATP